MKSKEEIFEEIKELLIKTEVCFTPKNEESKGWAYGFIEGLKWCLNDNY